MAVSDRLYKIKEKAADVASVAMDKVFILKEIARRKREICLLEEMLKRQKDDLAKLCCRDYMLEEKTDVHIYDTKCEEIYMIKHRIKARRHLIDELKQRLFVFEENDTFL